MICHIYENSLRPMQITIDGRYVTEISMWEEEFKGINYMLEVNKMTTEQEKDLLSRVIEEFDEYFAGRLKEFTIPIKYDFTPFMTRVYKVLQNTKYGEVYTYQDIAKMAGSPRAYRAVGSAMRKNKYAIVMPCHRVVKSSGEFGRFFNDDDLKERLIKFEKENKV